MTKSILMIHGVGCGGDVWDRMRPAFEADGWRVDAPTLYPEQRTITEPPASLSELRLSDYVDRMSAACARLTEETGEKPAIMGHSMGGYIAQKLAAQGDASAAVFLTPAQTPDCQVRDLRLLITFWSILKSGQKKIPENSYKVGRFGFGWGVVNEVDKSRHDEIYAKARYDSGKVYMDLQNSDPIDEKTINIPTLTIGAGKDRATPIKAVRRVGQKYSEAAKPGDYLEYPHNAHWILDEPGTDKVIADILGWLNRTRPASTQSSAPI
ncbi:alpha/beta hydrolase [Henriciella litoralis]|uniref:alpha/beta hydrolase n=1 Tax=Henriciella litoralis TaxID=568102 RepID=UPI0009FF17E1|nr:alpha/beta fold hydrolase [Henriciella litoralis]